MSVDSAIHGESWGESPQMQSVVKSHLLGTTQHCQPEVRAAVIIWKDSPLAFPVEAGRTRDRRTTRQEDLCLCVHARTHVWASLLQCNHLLLLATRLNALATKLDGWIWSATPFLPGVNRLRLPRKSNTTSRDSHTVWPVGNLEVECVTESASLLKQTLQRCASDSNLCPFFRTLRKILS